MIDSLYEAVRLMRRPDACLVQTNGRHPHWLITPGSDRVSPDVARQLLAHPQIRGDEDCLLPGLSQTWRMR